MSRGIRPVDSNGVGLVPDFTYGTMKIFLVPLNTIVETDTGEKYEVDHETTVIINDHMFVASCRWTELKPFLDAEFGERILH